MGTISKVVVDPLGISVSVPAGFCEGIEEDGEEAESQLINTIAKPALILEAPRKQLRHYYRSVGWHRTVLLTVEKAKDNWLVIECRLDPSTELMSSLFAEGRQIY
jgi:hypothetical protein